MKKHTTSHFLTLLLCVPYCIGQVKKYKDVKNLYILGDTSEVITNLDDSLVTINTVLSSRYVGGVREMVDEWRGKLITLQVITLLFCENVIKHWTQLEFEKGGMLSQKTVVINNTQRSVLHSAVIKLADSNGLRESHTSTREGRTSHLVFRRLTAGSWSVLSKSLPQPHD